MKQLRNVLLTGFLVLLPFVITIKVILWLVQTVDSSFGIIIPSHLLPFEFRGMGFLVAIVLIFLVGFFTQGHAGRLLVQIMDAGIRRISFVGALYGSTKKFLETIVKPGSDQFKGAVLVQFPRQGVYSIGFHTGKPDPKLIQTARTPSLVNIFIPCTPNPTSGFYLLVPEEDLIPLELSVQDAFKIVISMGIITSRDGAAQAPWGIFHG